MFRRLWQTGMIGLARSARVTGFMQSNRATSVLAGKYTGGGDAAAGVRRARQLLDGGAIRSSLFYLGEYIDDPEKAALNADRKIEVAGVLAGAGLDVHVSFDPTQLGHATDPEAARRRAAAIATAIQEAPAEDGGVHCLMFDMEDAGVIDATIAMHDDFRDRGLPVALTLQAYLRRTRDDLERQIGRGSRVRLVKGAFAAGSDISFTRRRDIKGNMRALIALMFSPAARESGFYPIVATHDDALQDFALGQARANGWRPGSYEFEMLLGVRGNLAETLAAKGERVRLYVPFGEDWWPYGVRRIGENPANALLLARSLFA